MAFACMSAILFAVSCNTTEDQEQTVPADTGMTMEIVSVSFTDCVIKMIPDSDAISYVYAIGSDFDYNDFQNGTMADMTEGTVNEDGSATDVTFDNLEPNTVYTVYSRAYGKNSEPGPVNAVKVVTADDGFLVEAQYVMDRSAGFRMEFSSNYYACKYYFGKPEDREAVLSGNVEFEYLSQTGLYSGAYNNFELNPDTDYVFYAIAYDRTDKPTELREVPVRTAKEGECPDADMSITNLDIYRGEYHIEPNDRCHKVTALLSKKGEHDLLISNWGWDVVGFIQNWEPLAAQGYVTIAMDGAPMDLTSTNNALSLDFEYEIYLLVYDENMEVAGLKHYGNIKTPSFNADAPTDCTVSIEVSEITSKGATYKYTIDDKTFAFMYDTVEADWFDEFSQTSSYTEFYVHNKMFEAGMYWAYGRDVREKEGGVRTFVEESGTSSFRYYAGACPMNENGPASGWCPLVLSDAYTTLAN